MPLGLGHLISLEILPLLFVRQEARLAHPSLLISQIIQQEKTIYSVIAEFELESESSKAERRLRSTDVDIHKSGDNIYLCCCKGQELSES
nr:hypothetical protein CFP56_40775 [Quercus suber]